MNFTKLVIGIVLMLLGTLAYFAPETILWLLSQLRCAVRPTLCAVGVIGLFVALGSLEEHFG